MIHELTVPFLTDHYKWNELLVLNIAHICTYTIIDVYMYTYIYMCYMCYMCYMYVYIYIYTYVYVYMYTYIHIYIYTYTYTHVFM